MSPWIPARSARGVPAPADRLTRDELLYEASERFADRHPEHSAKAGLTMWQRLLPAMFVAAVLVALFVNWQSTLVAVLVLANLAFLANVGFKVISTLFRPLYRLSQRDLRRAQRKAMAERGFASLDAVVAGANLPVYTILVPVYQEANVIGQILESFEDLRYPKDRLDVLVLLEESDSQTIAAARAANPPANVRLLIIPDGQPRTKPRACNYGLLFARGEYVVIYDAEDRPEPDQLLKVLGTFRHAERSTAAAHTRPLACVQASLNYYNADYNVLTRMFSIEYAHWFDSMLPGMDVVGCPIPLGGTSNHFLRSALVEVGGWDPYNVTEDADLGLRLSSSGYRVDVVDSTTWEEATAHVGPWIRQRTRWIKGYMVTAAVNLRHPITWTRKNGPTGLTTMLGLILGTPVAFLLYPIALGFTLGTWLLGPVFEVWLPRWLLDIGTLNMVWLNGLMVILSGIAAWRRYNWRIAAFAVFLPIYWLLHGIAAWRAAIQIGTDPHRWEKTPHGLTEEYDDSTVGSNGLPHSAASITSWGRAAPASDPQSISEAPATALTTNRPGSP